MYKDNPSYYAIIPADVRYDKRLKANEKLLFAEITSLTNKKGCCWASNKYFADLYGVTNQAISKWIKELKDNGYIDVEYIYKSGTKEIEKRIIRLTGVNNDEQVLINDDEGINICLQGYKQKFKDNNKNINIKDNNKINNINSEFENLWKEYPRKQGKDKALKAYIKFRASDGDVEKVKQGIEKYKRYIEANKIEQRYIKHGSTWFAGQCWDDEYEETKEVRKNNASYDIDELEKIK